MSIDTALSGLSTHMGHWKEVQHGVERVHMVYKHGAVTMSAMTRERESQVIQYHTNLAQMVDTHLVLRHF